MTFEFYALNVWLSTDSECLCFPTQASPSLLLILPALFLSRVTLFPVAWLHARVLATLSPLQYHSSTSDSEPSPVSLESALSTRRMWMGSLGCVARRRSPEQRSSLQLFPPPGLEEV